MALQYEVPEYKRIRVMIDTDAACEADDPFAISHALLTKRFDVKAIFAEQFGAEDTTRKSYDLIVHMLKLMKLSTPVYMGVEGSLAQAAGKPIAPAVKCLIEEARKEDEKPLFVLCLGAITNVAAAIRECPEIKNKMTVIWIGGHDFDLKTPPFREFNSGNDIEAANLVASSGIDLWLIPSSVYSKIHISLAEIQNRIACCGEIGKFLFENMINYNLSPQAGWTQGESWSIGDSPAVGIAMAPSCGTYEYRKAPVFHEDTSLSFEEDRPLIRVYKTVDSRFIIEDLIAKLSLCYRS